MTSRWIAGCSRSTTTTETSSSCSGNDSPRRHEGTKKRWQMGKGKWQTEVMMGICLVSRRSAAAGQNTNLAATPASMIQLIATPERFDNKQVSVIGFLNLEFEGD